jgi:hypothetical protein
MVKAIEAKFIGYLVSFRKFATAVRTHSSAHSFSFRICSSSSDEKLDVS